MIRYWLDSDLLIRYCLIRISWFGTNSIRYGWFGICICNHYLLTLRWNSWRHRCAQSTNLLTPIEILIHRAQWSCSCYTSLVFSPGCSLLECRDAWCVLRALLLGGSKMQGCQPVYTNDYFTTRTVSSWTLARLFCSFTGDWLKRARSVQQRGCFKRQICLYNGRIWCFRSLLWIENDWR